MKRIIWLVVLIYPLWGLSQKPNFIITNYTVEDGLPSNETYRIVQDRYGYIWIATDRGLTRWDGYEFKVYGSQHGLKDITVLDLEIDEKGTPWISTLSGDLYHHDYYTDRLIPYRFNNELHEYIGKKAAPYKFSFPENGSIIFSLPNSKPVTKIDSMGNLTQIFQIDPKIYAHCYFNIEDEIHIANIAGSPILIGRYGNGAPMYETKMYLNGTEFPSCPNPNYTAGDIVDAYKYSMDKLLIVSRMSNYFFENGKYQFCQHDKYNIRDIKFDQSKAIYVSKINNGGLMYYEDDEHFENDDGDPILTNVSIGGLLIDRAGDLWVCSLEKGIFHLKKNNVTSITKSHTKGIRAYLEGIALIEQTNQLKILSDEYQVIYEKEFAGELRGLSSCSDPDLLIILSSSSSYLNPQFELKDILSVHPRLVVPASSYETFVSDNDEILMVDYSSFIIYENPNAFQEGRCVQYRNYRMLDITSYKDNYYLATINGLLRQEDIYSSSADKSISGLKMRINDLELFRDLLLVGTNDQGLIVWNGEYMESRLTKSDGLLSNSIEIIKTYNDNFILIGTKNGISIVENHNGIFSVRKNITTSFGLPSNNILDLEIVDDQIYFATSEGSGVFTFDISLSDSTEVIIDEWQVNNIERKDFIYSSIENNVTIHYKTLDYRQEGRINYRYRLNEQPWTNNTNTSINYASLSPGNYQFDVQSQNENGIWGHVLSREFKIMNPWWATWWFRITVVVAIVGFGFYLYKRRVTDIKKEASVKEEIRQLELQALRAQMNPHFIFNCLTSIQRFIQQNESENAMTYLAKFAKLVRQTLNASSEEIHSLHDELSMLENYLALEKLRFKDLFTYDFQIEKDIDPLSISIPPMLIQPLVENSIKHGFEGIDYQGILNIRINQNDDSIEIEIEDNGKGISLASPNYKRRSFGSYITARRLELINLSRAELKVTESLTGKGTLIRMSIPQ